MDQSPASEMGISLVVPCLNEESSIAQVIGAARAGCEKTGLPYEIVVVDNGSTDNSARIALEKGARVIPERVRGYGAALRTGFNNARYEIMVMGDADMTYDFSQLDELVGPIREQKAGFVIGNRMRNIKPGAMPVLHRYVGTPAIALVLRFLFRNPSVHDPNCGMRAITKTAFRDLHCVTTGMEFASEMIVQAIRNGIAITERDIVYHPRVGESKLRSFRDCWRHLRFMLLYSPTVLLLGPGVIFWILGLLFAAPLAFGPVMIEERRFDIHFMIVGGLLNITSVQVITIGMLAKAYAHLSGLHHDPVIAWFYRAFNFEKLSIIAVCLVAAGLLITMKIVYAWATGGFGSLDQARPLFFALLLLVNGIQLAAAGYLFSIMSLPRRLDAVPPEVRDTGIVDQ